MKKRKAVLRNSMAFLLSAVMASSLTPAVALAETVGSTVPIAATQMDPVVVEVGEGKTYTSISSVFTSSNYSSTETFTINLTSNLTEAVVIPAGKTVTLNLNKHTITCPEAEKYALFLNDKAKVTVRDGDLAGGATATVRMGTPFEKGTCSDMHLTLENVKVSSKENAGGIWDYGIKNTLTLTGCTVKGDYWAIYHNGTTAGFKLTATDSTIEADNGTLIFDSETDYASAVYVSGSKVNTADAVQGMNNIKMDRCTVTGPTGIEGKYTNMVLTDCTVRATLDPSFAQNNNGSTGLGFAVVSSDNSMREDDPKPEANIVIDGGTYTGLVGLSQLEGISQYEGFVEATYRIAGGAFSIDPTGEYTNKVKYIPRGADGLYRCAHSGTPKTTSGASSATCGSDGYTGTTVCNFCKEVASYGSTIPATGEHAFGEWKTTKEATETEPGSQERACSVCGEKEAQETPALGHKPSEAWKSDANDHWKVCEGCGAELEEAPHSFGEWTVTKEATETEPGEKARSCSVCGATETEEIPALGHKPSEAWQSDANAHWKVCEGCGAELEKAAHAYGDWKVVKEATTEAAGLRERACGVCGHVQSEETPKLAPAVPEGGSGWVESEGGEWGYVEAGEPVEEGWKEVDGEWYYFEDEAMQTGWAQVEGEWYYLEESGRMDTGWKEVDGDWYYLEDTGKMATGWQEVGGEWYHLGKSGRMDTGWKKDGGAWYYLNGAGEGTEGSMATGWKKVGGEWYYLNRSGAMRSGWQKLSGTWYLLNAAHDGTFGAMLEGWQRVDASTGVPTSANSWYYLEPGSGAMAAGRWVGGYYVDASGLWVR